MRYLTVRWVLGVLGVLGGVAEVGAQVPLARAHAHNDYEHARPLLDALERGFGSVEADIHLVDGELLVAHDLEDVRPGRTLERLYLEPLRERVRRNGGRVYPDGPTVQLLIDIKSEAEATYAVLRQVLRRYADILTVFTAFDLDEGAVTAVISGNRPINTMAEESIRYAAVDGRLNDLYNAPTTPITLMPLVSSNWNEIAPWFGVGELSEEARTVLARTVRLAHNQGRKLRFWATTDNPAVWQVLFDAGVDYLNADDLDRLRAFLLEQRGNE